MSSSSCDFINKSIREVNLFVALQLVLPVLGVEFALVLVGIIELAMI